MVNGNIHEYDLNPVPISNPVAMSTEFDSNPYRRMVGCDTGPGWGSDLNPPMIGTGIELNSLSAYGLGLNAIPILGKNREGI